MAGLEPVAAGHLEPRVTRPAGAIQPTVLGHVGVGGGLAVDRPGAAVIVRRRGARLTIDVGEHAETELRVAMQHMHALLGIRAAMLGDEGVVGEQPLEVLADPLLAAGPGSARRLAAQSRQNASSVYAMSTSLPLALPAVACQATARQPQKRRPSRAARRRSGDAAGATAAPRPRRSAGRGRDSGDAAPGTAARCARCARAGGGRAPSAPGRDRCAP